jgi:flagellar protein FlbD
MIQITRLNHIPLILNSDLIEHIEVTPDTVITLTTGQTLIVLESPEEVVEKVVAFRRSIVRASGCALLERSGAIAIKETARLDEVAQAHGG